MIGFFNNFLAVASTGCGGKGTIKSANPVVGCGSTGLPTVNAGSTQLNEILTITFATLGAVSVLFIIIGGFRLVISGGDSKAVSEAKSTIMYSVIGLVIALSAEAIVSFALGFL